MGKSGKEGPRGEGSRGEGVGREREFTEPKPPAPKVPTRATGGGDDVPGNPGIGGPNRAEPVHRVALMISVGKVKIGPAELDKIRKLAAQLRCIDGVRQVDAIVWNGWSSFPEAIDEPIVIRGGRREPYRPSGVMVWMESHNKEASSRNAANLWETAKKILGDDPDGCEFNGVDAW